MYNFLLHTPHYMVCYTCFVCVTFIAHKQLAAIAFCMTASDGGGHEQVSNIVPLYRVYSVINYNILMCEA
jgi:hypothetical protein